jgi:hypothetical protein
MKKLIMNEDWETIEVEDTSSFFVLIFKQGSHEAGYIKSYDTDDTKILADYENLVRQYANVRFEDPASVLVIKVPATGQVKAMLEEAEYAGDETNEMKIEIINQLMGRADCEYITETVLMSLEEAKKRKKKKKKSTPKVTYLTGFPFLNDHRFNHACGSCDCDKNKNDFIADGVPESGDSSGESTGDSGSDSGSSDGGAMGESLTEAMTPLDKMKALENGTRGFNAAAASDIKLMDNLVLCAQHSLAKAAAVMIVEIQKRTNQGSWTLGPIPGINAPATSTTSTPATKTGPTPTTSQGAISPIVTFIDEDFQVGHLQIIKDFKNKPEVLVDIIERHSNSLHLAVILLVIALAAGETAVALAIKTWILNEITKQDFKQIISALKSNSKIIDKITAICNDESITEGVKKMNNLTEAKRYIKRYYIRPQNVFASNKAEILQRLAEVEADGANCSVYSLKALDDHDDVHLLQPKDIIYYYDEGVLYDKNHVPVLDYDLNVKNEEERPKISADATSDERFKDVYQDRMTDRTFAESFEDFYMDFDDVNVYGVKLKEGKEAEYTCCICGEDFEGYGNNPAPYRESGKCCDACNRKFVIPARLAQLQDKE